MCSRKKNRSTDPKTMPALVSMEHVFKTYAPGTPEELPALQDVSLHIDQGEFVSLVGASGSGKSTLMRILGFQERLTEGSYRFSGRETARLTDKELSRLGRQRIAVIPQNYGLDEKATVWENVVRALPPERFSQGDRRRQTNRALHLVGLADKTDCLPAQLSGGQRQRVAIARAAVQKPALVLADEPTAALDMETKEVVFRLLERLHQEGAAVVLITHDHTLAFRTQRIIQVREGKIQEDRFLKNAG